MEVTTQNKYYIVHAEPSLKKQCVVSGCVPLPDGPPGGLKGLFWAVGFLNAVAVVTLLFLGAAADLE